MRKKKNHPYRAYLLRCWQEGEPTPGEEARWRYSLEGILHQRSRQGFESLEALAAFLRVELTPKEDGLSALENGEQTNQ